MKLIVAGLALMLAWCAPAAGQDYAQRALPNVHQMQRPDRFMFAKLPDDIYRLGKADLLCTLPNGTQVNVALVNDPADFTFLAIRASYGPAILANNRRLKSENPQYAAFSFYRECGLHAIQKVTATSLDDGDVYDAAVLKTAECLAVIPSQHVWAGLSLNSISRQLKTEYGDRVASSRQELARCSDANYAAGVAAKIASRR
jgi:hypothetical protein